MTAQTHAGESARLRDAVLASATRAICRIVERPLAPRLSILAFHRVLKDPDPMYPDLLDERRFDALMGIVAKVFTVLAVGEAAQRLKSGSLPPRALCVTFDDGYADNATVAMPILRKYGVVGTFFVATGFLDGGTMFNDRLIHCVRYGRSDRMAFKQWGVPVQAITTMADRRLVADALIRRCKHLPQAEREAFVREIECRLGRSPVFPALMLRSSQVVDLHRGGMEIGGHTVSHPILRSIPDAEAEAEIAAGRHALEKLIDAPVDVFAYPNGKLMQDYDARHVEMVRRLGFRAAVTTAAGTATAVSHMLELPRFTPWDRHNLLWMTRLLRARLAGDPGGVRA
ncbi:MAG: polysaccharide deacetylase family protein [Rubrivivax sp.]|nr:polysaccharide deacetylase family protein [Rubrivivax sp.]